MSKQSEAKALQGYSINQKCCTCANMTFSIQLPACMRRTNEAKPNTWDVSLYGEQTRKRCAIGNFAVTSNATCNQWTAKV